MTAIVVGLHDDAANASHQPPRVEPAATSLSAPPGFDPGATADPLGRAEPVQLLIPTIGVDATIVSLGLNPDGTLANPPAIPDDPAGWYRGLASPGEVGPAVIVGHFDTAADRGVFFNLSSLRTGDTVTVTRRDGTTAEFTVHTVGSFARTDFPSAAVYGATGVPALRLVTCGGEYSQAGGYAESVVVFASLTDTDRPDPSAGFADDPVRSWLAPH